MTALKLLSWVFIVLLLLTAIPLLVVEDKETGRLIAALAAMFLGGFAVAYGLDALKTGTIRLNVDVIQRSTNPRLFLAACAAVVCCGIGLMALVVWSLHSS